MIRILAFLTNIFPVWVVVASGLALFYPTWFTWFDKQAIIFGLAVIMLGMGITLRFDDFRRVLEMPRPVAVGVAGQFLIMPLLGCSAFLFSFHSLSSSSILNSIISLGLNVASDFQTFGILA